MMIDPSWQELSRSGGVRLLAAGSGPPVVLFPGMEGSGESCLHLARPVVLTGPGRGRLLLVDYSGERHRFFGGLVDTVTGLLEAHLGGLPATWWGQSFGNLLLAAVRPRLPGPATATVLVSPFTGLPPGRLRLAAAVLALTPPPLYAATSTAVSRGVFGPAPRGGDAAFFTALRHMALGDLRRRLGWLRHGDQSGLFEALPGPLGVWFGGRDRLVDMPRQTAFFRALTRGGGGRVRIVDGCGHVLLTAAGIDLARRGVADWLAAPPPVRAVRD